MSLQRIDVLEKQNSQAWLEIEYTGREIVGNLQDIFDDAVVGSDLEIRRVQNRRIIERMMSRQSVDETLDDLNSLDVFNRCLESHVVPDRERSLLLQSYHEILTSLAEEDVSAEEGNHENS